MQVVVSKETHGIPYWIFGSFEESADVWFVWPKVTSFSQCFWHRTKICPTCSPGPFFSDRTFDGLEGLEGFGRKVHSGYSFNMFYRFFGIYLSFSRVPACRLRTDRSDNDEALLKESALLLPVLKIAPFGALILQDNCEVIPFLTTIQSRKVQRELCQLIGEAGQNTQHKDSLLAGLEKAAVTASSLGVVSHLANCFKLAGFQNGVLLDYLTTAVQRLGQKGFNNMPAIWREVKKCLALGVPEAVDPLLQNFRAFGSETLEAFTSKAPPDVMLYLIGAADRLDAPELTQKISTAAFKHLEADQLIKSLEGTKDLVLKNKMFLSILDKDIDKVDLSASLMLLRAADELNQLRVLGEKTESVLIKAIHQDTLVECVLSIAHTCSSFQQFSSTFVGSYDLTICLGRADSSLSLSLFMLMLLLLLLLWSSLSLSWWWYHTNTSLSAPLDRAVRYFSSADFGDS